MPLATVKQIRRYPVKSMGGEVLESVQLTAAGLVGDRAWAIRDEVRGQIVGAKKLPGLMNFKARYTQPPAASGSSPAEITFPDGPDDRREYLRAAFRSAPAPGHAVAAAAGRRPGSLPPCPHDARKNGRGVPRDVRRVSRYPTYPNSRRS